MSSPDYHEGVWVHGDPLWPSAAFENAEVDAYRLFDKVSKAAGLLVPPKVTPRPGCRVVVMEYNPVTVDTDQFGNVFADCTPRKLKLTETRWVPDNPNRSQGRVPMVVGHTLTVVESAFGDEFEQVYARPDMNVLGPDVVAFADNPLDDLQSREGGYNAALAEQAHYLGWLQMANARLTGAN